MCTYRKRRANLCNEIRIKLSQVGCYSHVAGTKHPQTMSLCLHAYSQPTMMPAIGSSICKCKPSEGWAACQSGMWRARFSVRGTSRVYAFVELAITTSIIAKSVVTGTDNHTDMLASSQLPYPPTAMPHIATMEERASLQCTREFSLCRFTTLQPTTHAGTPIHVTATNAAPETGIIKGRGAWARVIFTCGGGVHLQ